MEAFAEFLAQGLTPVPCVLCNERIKFADLLEMARDLGAGGAGDRPLRAARRRRDGPELHRAADAARDQSYFLFRTTRAQLEMLRFPLGGLEKREVRALAPSWVLPLPKSRTARTSASCPTAITPASSRSCARRRGAGRDRRRRGRVLGRHAGVIHFTVGQRKGLGFRARRAALRAALDAAQRAGRRGSARGAAVHGGSRSRDVNWLAPPAASSTARSRCARRGRRWPRVCSAGAGGAEVDAGRRKRVAPGQACVFYDGTRVLGGGWIARTEPAACAA